MEKTAGIKKLLKAGILFLVGFLLALSNVDAYILDVARVEYRDYINPSNSHTRVPFLFTNESGESVNPHVSDLQMTFMGSDVELLSRWQGWIYEISGNYDEDTMQWVFNNTYSPYYYMRVKIAPSSDFIGPVAPAGTYSLTVVTDDGTYMADLTFNGKQDLPRIDHNSFQFYYNYKKDLIISWTLPDQNLFPAGSILSLYIEDTNDDTNTGYFTMPTNVNSITIPENNLSLLGSLDSLYVVMRTISQDHTNRIYSNTVFVNMANIPYNDSDGDGVDDSDDAFPNDISASVDTDGDGYPDSWNDGFSQSDSISGLTLDDYPNDSTKWDESIHGGTVPSPPQLSYAISGINVTATWTSVSEATGYTLYFAPNPFTGPDSIQHVDMGMETSISVNLWDGASYYIAVTASNGGVESSYSNIELFTIKIDSNDIDNDFDGFTENQGDCNDNDPNINPGSIEIANDGIDQDCDGKDLQTGDLSYDGYWSGQTDQGETITFNIVDNRLIDYDISYTINGIYCSVDVNRNVTFTPGESVNNGTISIYQNDYNEIFSLSGAFQSDKIISGTWSASKKENCIASDSGTWSATKQP